MRFLILLAAAIVVILIARLDAAPIGTPTTFPATAPAPATQESTELAWVTEETVTVPNITDSAPKRITPGGVGRGGSKSNLELAVLAPLNTGFTAQDQPKLVYHLSETITLPVVFSIGIEQHPTRLARATLPSSMTTAGFHVIDLSTVGVTLVPDACHEWVIAVVIDPNFRSKDLVASGFIQRMEMNEAARASIRRLPLIKRVQPLTDLNLYYDAVAAAVTAVEANPANPRAIAYRAKLLSALALTETSAADVRSSK